MSDYPRKNDNGETVWACCESNIGPACEHARSATQHIVDAANKWFRDRADNEHPSDWSDGDSYRRFVALLRTGRAFVVNSHTVGASVAGGTCWGYVTADALDNASQGLPDTAMIDYAGRYGSPDSAKLTW